MMYQILFYFICLNLSFAVVNECMTLIGFPIWYNPQVSPEEMSTTFDPASVVGGWTSWIGTVLYIGDVVGGLFSMFNHVVNFFLGFPIFLNMLGAPGIIVDVLAAINGFIWCWAIWSWISGRRADT